MKFSVSVDEFIEAISPAVKISTKGLKDLNIISIEAKESEVMVTAFGGELGINSPISDINVSDLKYNYFKEGKCSIITDNLIQSLKSFPKGDEVVLDSNKKELKIYSVNDKTEVQVLPLNKEEVKLPCIAEKFSKEIEIDREMFIKGIKNISFAIGFEDKRPKYKYWRLITDNNVRFVAGTGGIFAVYDIEGENLINSDGQKEFLFTGSSKDVISEVLSSSECEKITIKQAQATKVGDKNIPDQIVLNFDGKDLLLVGFDPEINWGKVNIDSVLKRENQIEVKTSLPNWIHAVKGIRATYTKDVQKDHSPHIADVKINTKEKIIYAEVNAKLKSSRKICIDEVSKDDIGEEFSFRCPSQFLDDMVNRSLDKKGDMKISAVANNKPILIKYPPISVDDNKEKMTIFFAPSNNS